MTMISRSLLARCTVGLALLSAMPVLAQTTPPPPPAPGAPAPGAMDGPMGGGPGKGMRHGRGGGGEMARAFGSMSEAGQATMRDAMRSAGDRDADHASVKAARDRMLAVLDADKLDTAALKRAMDDERRAANAGRERSQAAMAAGFAKLSVADRKAFVADARAMKTRMEARVKEWRDRRGPGGPGGDLPPPL